MTLFKTPNDAHYVLETGMRIGPVEGNGFEIAGMNSVEWCQYKSEIEAQYALNTLLDSILSINAGLSFTNPPPPVNVMANENDMVINANESMAQAIGSLEIARENPWPNHKTWQVDPPIKPTRGRPRSVK